MLLCNFNKIVNWNEEEKPLLTEEVGQQFMKEIVLALNCFGGRGPVKWRSLYYTKLQVVLGF